MKKLFLPITILALSLTFTSCSDSDEVLTEEVGFENATELELSARGDSDIINSRLVGKFIYGCQVLGWQSHCDRLTAHYIALAEQEANSDEEQE